MKKLKPTALLVMLTLSTVLLAQTVDAAGVKRVVDTQTKTAVEKGVKRVVNPFAPSKAHAQEAATSDTSNSIPESVTATIEAEQEQAPVSCQIERHADETYSARFVAVRKKGVFAKGELMETKVYIQNTGNMPWFSADSGCPYLVANLGTDKTRDRNSVFFTDGLLWETDWEKPNRIRMTTKRVDPGEMAQFIFWSRAPQTDGLYREYFTPVLEGVTWMDGGTFFTDYKVGNPNMDIDKKDLLEYIKESTDLSKIDLSGNKSINVQISTQRMQLKIGDITIKEFPVSTGTYRTPTPLGTTTISHKQEVRVAGGWPHYIMPKWMTYRGGGYGIHALPSLANDNGVFWNEALNHIGTRRSHGCIRLLPQDAVFAYNFADIGTVVHITN